MFSISDTTHRRYNFLTGEWILVSPHRGKRPWQGQKEVSSHVELPAYDENCYLCSGNARSEGFKNPQYTGPFVFTNDFSAIKPEIEVGAISQGFFKAQSERGTCKVICFSEQHNKTVPELSQSQVEDVITVWIQETQNLAKESYINHIQIFENKGAVMGCSNPHPHCQIWAQESIPQIVSREAVQFENYTNYTQKNLLEAYILQELETKERIVYQNEHFIALVPFWAVWPFEILVVPLRVQQHIYEMTNDEQKAFAEIYQVVTTKYDNLFTVSFPYSAGIHQAPVDGENYTHWCWHMHFYPPLLRSAEVKKFMVGYEMLAEPQRDITAEQSAEILRNCSITHYKISK